VRYLILSDIHANRQALDAVIAHSRGRYDAIGCCGDIVGYGADPDYAVDWVRENVQYVVRGNHDKACAGLEDLEWFNPSARASAIWTLMNLDEERLEWLRRLPQGPVEVGDFHLIHGSPIDEDEYVIGVREAAEASAYLERPLTFFGHTHLQGGFLLHRNGVLRVGRPSDEEAEETIELEHDSYYMVNPGSVGQPRDGDARAAYVIYSSEDRTVTFHRVPYDIVEAQRRIRAAGLPDLLADRLLAGR
jgi:diadenosine tetraphosphatase ApaH/serine/threonine PP2A family protein phosphatase